MEILTLRRTDNMISVELLQNFLCCRAMHDLIGLVKAERFSHDWFSFSYAPCLGRPQPGYIHPTQPGAWSHQSIQKKYGMYVSMRPGSNKVPILTVLHTQLNSVRS